MMKEMTKFHESEEGKDPVRPRFDQAEKCREVMATNDHGILKKIVSGAQTGVDRAGLDAALANGFPCGGWCPEGRIDEEGRIPDHYPVRPLKKGGYHQRTLQNIIDSDGTLIFYDRYPEGGTEQTLFRCIKQRKPYKLIDFSVVEDLQAVSLAHEFVIHHDINSLNIAGPRASKLESGQYEYVLAVVTGLIRKCEWKCL